MRFVLPLALALLLAPVVPATGGGTVADLTLSVDGESAYGLLATPAGPAKGLVVILHGYGHQAESHRGHLQHLADQGWGAVAMDYRGPVEGFPLSHGAADSIAGMRHARVTLALDDEPTYLYSVSMGTAVAALFLPQVAGEITAWVDNEGLAMLAETWAEAVAVSPAIEFGRVASLAIQNETGGTPAEAPEAYVARSAALRAHEFGLEAAILAHGLNDGLVPYDQGREMATALRAAGVRTDFHTFVDCAPGSEGTTITGHATLGGQGLCGHGTESLDGHTLTRESFRLLDELLSGVRSPSDREFVESALGP